MLNYKVKSHRGRASTNKTDALCIVETKDKITRVFAQVIPDKKSSTIIRIICAQVVPGAIIWTDEHKSYVSLANNGFIHQSLCHKFEFVDKQRGTHTQFVESFNNQLKIEIKKEKD
ncbi:hypothetical protein H311_02427 [Anncaliia algerae PRA109]|nr:hypothetical protein H311_02427 [Anncaliia algerae PRA109]